MKKKRLRSDSGQYLSGSDQEEFLLVDEKEYDFELKQKFKSFANIQLEEFKTEDEVFYLPVIEDDSVVEFDVEGEAKAYKE